MEAKKLVNEQNSGKELTKALGLFESITIVIGMVIGSGIFFKPSIVFKNAGAPGLGLLAWVAGGIITIAAGLTIAEIGAAIPRTGGLFVYLKELYGEKWAFLFGWVQTLIYSPGATAALAIVFATQATSFVPMTALQQKLLAIFMMALLLAANAVSTKFGGKIQAVATIAKLLPIIILVSFGLIKGTAHDFTPMFSSASTTAGFGAAILGTLWAYDGWINVASMAGEMKNPGRDLPRAIVIGLAVVMLAYIGVNIAAINVLPTGTIIASKKAASDVAIALFGKSGGAFITAGILVSIFGALNGWALTGPRVPLAMANDGLLPFPGFFGKISEKYGTPINASIFQFVIASLFVITGSFDMITNLVVFVVWIFFLMGMAGIFVLRSKHKHLERPYKVPLFPITPAVGLIGGAYIVISTLLTDTTNALLGLGITILGIPVYVYLYKKNRM